MIARMQWLSCFGSLGQHDERLVFFDDIRGERSWLIVSDIEALLIDGQYDAHIRCYVARV